MLDRIVQAVIRRSLAETGGKKRKVVATLKINNHMLYKALGRNAVRSEAGNQVE
jgi:DNA-binding NtrC family response regulator